MEFEESIFWPGVDDEHPTIRVEWSLYLQGETDIGHQVPELEQYLLEQVHEATFEALLRLGVELDWREAGWGADIRQMGSNAQDFHAVFMWIAEILIGSLAERMAERPVAAFSALIRDYLGQIRRQLDNGKEVTTTLSYHREWLEYLCREHAEYITGSKVSQISSERMGNDDGSDAIGPERHPTYTVTAQSDDRELTYVVTSKGKVESFEIDGQRQTPPNLIDYEDNESLPSLVEQEFYGTTNAPTDYQLEEAPIVSLAVDLPWDQIQNSHWMEYTDYGSNPLPTAFQDALMSSIVQSLGIEAYQSEFVVRMEDRPPRADGLFPAYFVDLGYAMDFLKHYVPSEVASAVIALAVQELVERVRSRLPGKKLPANSVRRQLSPAVIELLCVNHALLDHPAGAPYAVQRIRFNTDESSGYPLPVDETIPMGWIINVEAGDSVYSYKIERNTGRVLSLEIMTGPEVVPVRNVDLLNPEATRQGLQRLLRFPENRPPEWALKEK